MAKPRIAKLGECYRVKNNEWTRRYGYRMDLFGHTGQDCVALPGEVGTIEEFRWTSADGSRKIVRLMLVFSRGRTRTLNEDGTIPDAHDLVRVPRSALAPEPGAD